MRRKGKSIIKKKYTAPSTEIIQLKSEYGMPDAVPTVILPDRINSDTEISEADQNGWE